MSYRQVTDLDRDVKHGRDFKDNLIEYTKILKQIRLNQNLCIRYKKDRWYYTVADVALWSVCGSIKTVLFLRLDKRPKGKTFTFHGMEQFLFKYKNKYAIYNVQVSAQNSYKPNIITGVGFQKIPNLKECICN